MKSFASFEALPLTFPTNELVMTCDDGQVYGFKAGTGGAKGTYYPVWPNSASPKVLNTKGFIGTSQKNQDTVAVRDVSN